MKFNATEHLKDRLDDRKISQEEINEVLRKGLRYNSNDHPGQMRYIHHGVCVIVKSMKRGRDKMITAYRIPLQ